MIPEAAVEAAGRAIYELQYGPEGWDGLPDKPKSQYRAQGERILEAAAPSLFKDMRQMSLVEIENRDNPERMAAARATIREEARAARAAAADRIGKRYAHLYELTRNELRAQAWDEGFRDGLRQDAEGDDGPRFENPHRNPETFADRMARRSIEALDDTWRAKQ